MPNLSGCTIVFDLDGTLVDTAPDIHRALNVVMSEQGLPPATESNVRAFVGQGARGLIVRAFAVHKVIHEDAEVDRLTDRYTELYRQDIARGSKPMPGLEFALKALQAAGATFCVCTNKRTHLSNELLAALGLGHWFAAVVGGDAVPRRKPHPDHFIAAVRAARGDPAFALMVGDSTYDVASAKAAKAPVAVYAHGYTDTAPELLGADAVFKHFDELPDLAARLLRPQPMPRT